MTDAAPETYSTELALNLPKGLTCFKVELGREPESNRAPVKRDVRENSHGNVFFLVFVILILILLVLEPYVLASDEEEEEDEDEEIELHFFCKIGLDVSSNGNHTMTRKSEIENLVKVKTELAEKYQRLARLRPSKPTRERLFRRAESYRQQAANIAERLNG